MGLTYATAALLQRLCYLHLNAGRGKASEFHDCFELFFRCIGAVDGRLSISLSPSSSLVFAASRANLKGLLKAGREQRDECVARRCCHQRRSLTYSMKGVFFLKKDAADDQQRVGSPWGAAAIRGNHSLLPAPAFAFSSLLLSLPPSQQPLSSLLLKRLRRSAADL